MTDGTHAPALLGDDMCGPCRNLRYEFDNADILYYYEEELDLPND
jgi:hypothetical protein